MKLLLLSEIDLVLHPKMRTKSVELKGDDPDGAVVRYRPANKQSKCRDGFAWHELCCRASRAGENR